MTIDTSGILAHIDPQRLLDTATALVAVPSPTRDAGAAADCLAAILAADGFTQLVCPKRVSRLP